MQVQVYFRTATVHFYQGNHDQALMAIDRYIQAKPCSSLAYNNRALINFESGQTAQAREDISVSLQLNHLNYVAYFNLFSVLYRQKEYEGCLGALGGALSCLYLIKGRLLQDKQNLRKALNYSSDNLDALLLLVLLEVKDKNYREALLSIEVYSAINSDQRILTKLRALITLLRDNYSEASQQALYDYLLDNPPVSAQFSGKGPKPTTYLPEQLPEVIQSTLREFNALYTQINHKIGGASYLIADRSQKKTELQMEGTAELKELVQSKQIMATI